MGHKRVRLLTDDDGEKVDSPRWCLSVSDDGSPRTLCTGECYGEGEGSATFKEEYVEKGGITCRRCMERIRWMKSLRI